MKRSLSSWALAATIGLALVVPFAALEAVNTGGFATYGFPHVLFGFLWLLAFAFVAVLISVIRPLTLGEGVLADPAMFLLKTSLMMVIAVVWLGLLNDQMPCFLGVPNCD